MICAEFRWTGRRFPTDLYLVALAGGETYGEIFTVGLPARSITL